MRGGHWRLKVVANSYQRHLATQHPPESDRSQRQLTAPRPAPQRAAPPACRQLLASHPSAQPLRPHHSAPLCRHCYTAASRPRRRHKMRRAAWALAVLLCCSALLGAHGTSAASRRLLDGCECPMLPACCVPRVVPRVVGWRRPDAALARDSPWIRVRRVLRGGTQRAQRVHSPYDTARCASARALRTSLSRSRPRLACRGDARKRERCACRDDADQRVWRGVASF